MKNLHQKIADQDDRINQKKQQLENDYMATKQQMSSPRGLSLATIGGLVIGFMLLPKKFRIIKSVLKAYSMAATIKGFMDIIPQNKEIKRKNEPHV